MFLWWVGINSGPGDQGPWTRGPKDPRESSSFWKFIHLTTCTRYVPLLVVHFFPSRCFTQCSSIRIISASKNVSAFVDHSHSEQWAYKSIISPRWGYLIRDLILNLPLYDCLAPRPQGLGQDYFAWIVKTFFTSVCNSSIQAVPLLVLFNFCWVK